MNNTKKVYGVLNILTILLLSVTTKARTGLRISFYERDENIFDGDGNFTVYCMAARHYYVYQKRNVVGSD